MGLCTTTLVMAAHKEFMHVSQQNVDFCLLYRLLDGCYVINKAFSFVSLHILKGMCTHQVLISRLTRFIPHVLLHAGQKKQKKKTDQITKSQGEAFLSWVNPSLRYRISRISAAREKAQGAVSIQRRSAANSRVKPKRQHAVASARCGPPSRGPGITDLKSSRLKIQNGNNPFEAVAHKLWNSLSTWFIVWTRCSILWAKANAECR